MKDYRRKLYHAVDKVRVDLASRCNQYSFLGNLLERTVQLNLRDVKKKMLQGVSH